MGLKLLSRVYTFFVKWIIFNVLEHMNYDILNLLRIIFIALILIVIFKLYVLLQKMSLVLSLMVFNVKWSTILKKIIWISFVCLSFDSDYAFKSLYAKNKNEKFKNGEFTSGFGFYLLILRLYPFSKNICFSFYFYNWI